jgi:hypothetical protein
MLNEEDEEKQHHVILEPTNRDDSIAGEEKEKKKNFFQLNMMTCNKVHIGYFSFKLLICDNEDSFFYPC